MTHAIDDTDHEAPERDGDDWAADLAPRRPASRRLPIVLVALVLVAGGFLGGTLTTQRVEESRGTELPNGIVLPDGVLPDGFEIPEGIDLSNLPMGGGSGGLAGLGGGFPGGGLAALVGSPTYTVVVVDGPTLYLQDGSGETVKVVTDSTTTVRRLAKTTTDGLRPGDEVSVTGNPDEDGTILAERVEQTS